MSGLRSGGFMWGTDAGDDDERELTAAERQALIKQQVARLQTDPFSTKGEDKEFRNYVGGAYRHVYGSNDERRQAGLYSDATPLRADLPPFQPTPQSRHALLDKPVGPTLIAPNDFADVANVQRLLSGAGRYVLDMRNEQGGVYSGPLEQAIKSYQRDNGLAEDGVLLPNGPTVSALKRELFGRAGNTGRAGDTDDTGEAARTGIRDDRGTHAPQLARHIDPATTRIHDGHVPNFLQASDPGARRKQRGDERDYAQAERRNPSSQLAQNEPAPRDPSNPWGNAGDVRRKDNDELARMGYGPGVWLPDRSDPTGQRVILYDVASMKKDTREMQPLRDSRGSIVQLDLSEKMPVELRNQVESRKFSWHDWKFLNLDEAALSAMNYRPRRVVMPLDNFTVRSDAHGDGLFPANRSDENGKVRPHASVDMKASPGSKIYAPITGEVVANNADKRGRHGIILKGTGEFDGINVFLNYVVPSTEPKVGSTVKAGDQIATLTFMPRYYGRDAVKNMQNHLHFQIKIGRYTNWNIMKGAVDPISMMGIEWPEP